MAGFGQVLGGALAGVGTGMVQMAQLQWQSALANLEREDRRAERAEDRAWRAQDREDDQKWRAEDRAADQKWRTDEAEKDRKAREADREDEQEFRAGQAAADRAAADKRAAADRAARGDDKPEDKRGKQMLEELKERYATETFDENSGKTIKSVDTAKVKQAMFANGYDSYGNAIPMAPKEAGSRQTGRLYRTPNGKVGQWTRQGWVEVYGGAGN